MDTSSFAHMQMADRARRVTLPLLTLTEASAEPSPGAQKVVLRSAEGPINYYRKPVRDHAGKRCDGGPEWALGQYARFPIVLDHLSRPWPEANLYLVESAEIKTEPNMLTLGTLAEDLAAFWTFVTDMELDWLAFGPRKWLRPTYRYSAHLKRELEDGRLKPSVARRRMSAVIRFYTWLLSNSYVTLENPPWVERSVSLSFKDAYGRAKFKEVKTTDVSLRASAAEDPFDDRIEDGGKLRPMTPEEQRALLGALSELGNTEVKLAHQVALLSGAREQTVLTFRLRHVEAPPESIAGDTVRVQCGPGTGIDTKQGKRGILHIPKFLYTKLHVYAKSDRARRRQERSPRGDDAVQYLFLTQHGKPFYESTADRREAVPGSRIRSTKQGQSLRTFIAQRVIPLVQKKLSNTHFRYQFHDLRASYGMNFVDASMGAENPMPRERVLKLLSAFMWHNNPDTTLKYLDYRRNLALVEAADDSWHAYLEKLVAGEES